MLKITSFIFTIVYSFSSHALFGSKKLDASDVAKFEQSIIDKDFESFKKILDGKKTHQYWGYIEYGFGHKALGIVTSPQNWESYGAKMKLGKGIYCRPQFVKHLIGMGAKPTENVKIKKKGNLPVHSQIKIGHLSGAINSFCLESVEFLLGQLNPAEIAQATKSYQLIKYEKYANDKTIASQMVKIAVALINKNKEHCKSQNQNCEAVEYVKNDIEKFKGRENRRIYLATKEGRIETLGNKICEHLAAKKGYLRLMKEEKEKAKVSGLVNKLKLKAWGDKAYEENELAQVGKERYRSLAGKSFSTKSCQ